MQNKNLNSFEKTDVRWGIFKIFSSQNYNRSTNVVLAANVGGMLRAGLETKTLSNYDRT